MKRFLLATLFFAACGGSTGLQVRSLSGGSLVDRIMAFQESTFALIGQSASSDEAANKIQAYCADNQAAIAQMQQDSQAIAEGPDAERFGNELASRTEKLMQKAQELLKDKEAVMTDGKVLIAMAQCRGEAPIDGPGGEPPMDGPSEENVNELPPQPE